MPLERAIHKLSGEPAAVYGLAGRGTIEVGNAADVASSTPTRWRPGRCAVVTFPPTVSASLRTHRWG